MNRTQRERYQTTSSHRMLNARSHKFIICSLFIAAVENCFHFHVARLRNVESTGCTNAIDFFLLGILLYFLEFFFIIHFQVAHHPGKKCV